MILCVWFWGQCTGRFADSTLPWCSRAVKRLRLGAGADGPPIAYFYVAVVIGAMALAVLGGVIMWVIVKTITEPEEKLFWREKSDEVPRDRTMQHAEIAGQTEPRSVQTTSLASSSNLNNSTSFTFH